jgi:ElaB/YqjD/DUF883 family membrane-anchored ribosome-binding protein
MEPRETFDDMSAVGGAGTYEAPGPRTDPVGTAAAAAERAKEATAQALKDAKEKVNRAYERSSDAVSQAYSRAMDYSRENPRNATLVALGAGFGLGLLFAYGVTGRPRNDRRFFPAVASTLADAVLDAFARR